MDFGTIRNSIAFRISETIFKIFFVTFIIVYVGSQFVSAIVPIDDIVYLIEENTGADLDIIFSTEDEYEDTGFDAVDEYLNQDFYNTYSIITTLAAIIGTIVLSRMRNVYETMGLLLAFIIPRKRKNWGTIYDKQTKKPVPFAVIRLYEKGNKGKKSKKIKLETVSDTDGKYRLHIEDTKKKYIIKVEASGYVDYEGDLNYVRGFLIDKEGAFVLDLYLDRIGGQKERMKRITYMWPRLYWYVMLGVYFFSIVYLVYAIYYYWAFPGSLYGIINLGLFIFSVTWNSIVVKERLKTSGGRILDNETKLPVPGVVIHLYRNLQQVESQVTDSGGNIRFRVRSGDYDIRLQDKGYLFSETSNKIKAGKTKFLQVKINDEGQLLHDVFLEGRAGRVVNSAQQNPFN